MNWTNYAFILIIITTIWATSTEARGGRGGGGGRSSGSRSSGSRSSGSSSSGYKSSGSKSTGSKSSGSGGGGFWGSLFGGSSSSSKTSSSHSSPSSSSSSSLSSSSSWEPSQQPSYNPYLHSQHTNNFESTPFKSSSSSQSSSSLSNWKPYQHTSYNSYPNNQHTVNYDNLFGSSSGKASDSTDFLSGYMAGNLLSNHHKVYNNFDNDYIHPRHSFMGNNERESTTTATTPYGMDTDMSELLNVLSQFKNNPNDFDSLNAYFARTSNKEYSKPFGTTSTPTPSTTETLVSTPSTTSELPISSTEVPSFTSESTTTMSELTSSIPQTQSTPDNRDKVMDSHIAVVPNEKLLSSPMTSSGEIVPATTESTQEANLDISTPYGLICSPMIYNEVNEFGVNLIIEKLACYPALEPVAPLE